MNRWKALQSKYSDACSQLEANLNKHHFKIIANSDETITLQHKTLLHQVQSIHWTKDNELHADNCDVIRYAIVHKLVHQFLNQIHEKTD